MLKRPPLKRGLSKKIFVISSIVFAVVALGFFLAYGFMPSDVISDNVYVNSLGVGGLTEKEAENKIAVTFNEEYFNKTVAVNYNGSTCELNLGDNVSVDAGKTAQNAFKHRGNVFSNLFGNDKIVVPFVLETTPHIVRGRLSEFFMEAEKVYDLFVFNDDYTSVTVDATKLSRVIDIDKTLELVYENAKNDKYDGVDAIVLEKGDERFAQCVYYNLVRKPANATVGINEDKSTFIIPEVIGIEADKEEFLKLYAENNGKFTIDVKPVSPEITANDLDINFYQDVLGEYTSNYDERLVNRTKNVKLAASFVDGTIIMPGENFSYNRVVGKRTYERGFVDATVYTGEGTEEGIGGGICQVSSTIYCAQLRANLKTITRYNHSYTIVYVPLGQDATVVYGSLDYVFKNDTNFPIKIFAQASGGKLTVKIMGTKSDKSLTYDVVSVTNYRTPRGEKKIDDPTLPLGETKVKQAGQDGAVASAYKVYYKNGVEIDRKFIDKSIYKPMNKIILVGTKPVDEPSSDTGTEDVENPVPPEDVEVPDEETDLPEENDGGGTDVDVENSEITQPEETEPHEEEVPELSDTGL